LDDDFFRAPFPKTTGPEHFSVERLMHILQGISGTISHADVLNTLNMFSAQTIANGICKIADNPEVFLSGGGVHNTLLTLRLAQLLPHHTFRETDALGVHPDAKEAVLFALLANECVAGDPQVFEGRIVGSPAISMGKISFPD